MAVVLRIEKRQTTYWDFVGPSKTSRAHFIEKQEQHFVESECPTFEVVASHPVLLNYQFPWHALYISSSAARPEELVEQVAASMATEVAPWRNPMEYFNPSANVLSILVSGHGLLLRAPTPLAIRASHQLTEARITFRALPEKAAHWPMQALIAGHNFVVAKEFRIEP